MTTTTTRIKYLLSGFGLMSVALVCAFGYYLFGVIRVSLVHGEKVRIDLGEYFHNRTVDELFDANRINQYDVEDFRARRLGV